MKDENIHNSLLRSYIYIVSILMECLKIYQKKLRLSVGWILTPSEVMERTFLAKSTSIKVFCSLLLNCNSDFKNSLHESTTGIWDLTCFHSNLL